MSHRVLRESEAIVILGHQHEEKKNVSKDVKALGLTMLKAAPAECLLITVPDFVQPRYSLYKSWMSAFVYSSMTDTKVTNQKGGYLLTFDMFNPNSTLDERSDEVKLIPISPPPVVLAWAIDTSEEVWESLHKDLKGTKTEGVSGGKRALFFTPPDWFSYTGYQGRGLNPIADAPYNSVNPTALGSFKSALVAVTGLIHACRYPAFQDFEHESGFFTGGTDPMEEVTVKVSRTTVEGESSSLMDVEEPAVAPDIGLPHSDSNVKHQDLAYQNITYTGLPDAVTHIDITTGLDDLPPGGGLWFPYFSALSKYDNSTVPNLLKRYTPLVFGSSRAITMSTLETIIAEWKGINAHTDAGKELSHIAKVIEVALEGQARPIPLFRRGMYVGSVVLGVGYKIRFDEQFYTPASQEQLRSAIIDSDSHLAALREIAGYFAAGDRAEVMAVSTMLELHELVISKRLKSADEEKIVTYAHSLIFKGHQYWSPNLSNIKTALDLIRLNASNPTTSGINLHFPLHPDYLFSTDILELTWSCFGHMAPSFRHPNGAKFLLKDEMSYRQKTATGMTSRPLVRIYVRTKPLETAIEDLKWVRSEKAIENPTQAPRSKESQAYIDKNFSGTSGIALHAALRTFAGVDVGGSGKGKRKADDEAEMPSKKKGRGESSIVVDI